MYDEKKVIFKYELKDAIGLPITSIVVTDDTLYLNTEFDNDIKKTIKVEKIIDIINKYGKDIKELKNKKVPSIPILDGYINSICFKLDDKKYTYSINNLVYYSEEEVNNSKYLSLIFALLDDIYDELEKLKLRQVNTLS